MSRAANVDPRYTDADAAFMRRALRLARRGLGRVEPNPMVGCVLVKRGQVIGEGWHRKFGGAHAEVSALRSCSESPRGATAYVTLEPCCYFGKTPPCTEALLAAGVQRLVAGTSDPNPRVAGQGFAKLRVAGVAVVRGVCEDDARQLIAPFVKRIAVGRPWVIAKWAQSLDGCIATRGGDSKWISDEACRRHAHRTRGWVDAIVVGVNTALADDPLLTCRVGTPRRVATRVVIDPTLRISSKLQLVRTARDVPTMIVCGEPHARRGGVLEPAGCRLLPLPMHRRRIEPAAMLDAFGGLGWTNVLFEGGGRLLGAMQDAAVIDEFHIYVSPRLIGGENAIHALSGAGPQRVADGIQLDVIEHRKVGDGWFIRGHPRVATSSAEAAKR